MMLVSCASSAPREKRVITVDDVDIFSRGARNLIRVAGPIDLNSDPRIVCEERAPIGSQLPKLVCMTPEEMAVVEREAEEELLDIQDIQERVRESNPYNR